MSAPNLEAVRALAEEALESGDFDAARLLLDKARERFGAVPELELLDTRCREVSRLSLEPEIALWVQRAQQLIHRADYQSALEPLGRALALQPDDEEVLALVERTQKAAERHAVAVERQQAAARAAHEIAVLLDAGKAQDARSRLSQARSSLGRHKIFDGLETRLSSLLEDVHRQDVDRHVARAQARLERRDFQGALHQAEQALALDSQSAGAAQVLTAVEQHRTRVDRRQHEALAVEQVRTDVERLIAAGEMPRAQQRLSLATDNLGQHEVFDQLAAALDSAKKDRELQRRIEWKERRAREADALIQEATRRASGQDFEAAVARLESALELDPTHPDIAERLSTHRAALERQQQEKAHQAELDEAVLGVRHHLDAARLEEARAGLAGLRQRFGDGPRARALGQRLDAMASSEHTGRLPSPANRASLGGAARQQLRRDEVALAHAYSWSQALTWPLRGAGPLAIGLLAILLAGGAMVARPWPWLALLSPLVAALLAPRICELTLSGGHRLTSLKMLGLGGVDMRRSLGLLAFAILAVGPLILLMLSRHKHGLLFTGSGLSGWVLVSILLWLGCLLTTAAIGVATAFGWRLLWRLDHLVVGGGSSLLAIGALAFVAVSSTVLLRSVVEPELGIPLAALLEAYAMMVVPHLVGVMVRGRRLSWAQRYVD